MSSFLVGFVLGALAGWTAAKRMASEEGEEGGASLPGKIADFQARGDEMIERIKDNTRTLVEEGTQTLQKALEEAKVVLKQAVEEGRMVAARKSAELEELVRKAKKEEGTEEPKPD
ncbi:MAG: hypothetical protein V3U90_01690 [Dehalococcoidia bacterium]